VHDVDVFMTAGTLQYMPKRLPGIIDEFNEEPRHVLIHNLPVHAEKEFSTIQNLGLCEVPYRIYSVALLCEEMKSRGYELIERWVNDRKIEIPFIDHLPSWAMADSIFVIVSEDTAVQISAGAGGERQIQSPTDNVEFLVRRAKARFSVGRKFRRAIFVPAHSTRSGREVNESAEAPM